ncbi:hypothetical protein ABYF34_04695 [Buchananella felis]|uniref:hypothetical protein n=1 Tax=Buchananella felis TaxID=3231492 RepID=UPI003528C66C
MKTKRSIAWIVGSALAALTLAGCSGTTQPGATGSAPPVTGPRPVASQSVPAAQPFETPFKTPTTAESPAPSVVDVNGEPVEYYTGLQVGQFYGPHAETSWTKPPLTPPTEILYDESVMQWDYLEVVSEHELRVHGLSGTRGCYGNRLAVEEGDGVLRLALVDGYLRDEPTHACTAEGVGVVMSVKTEQDLTKIVVVEAAADDVFLRKGV